MTQEKPIISVKNLTKKFGNFVANNRLNFEVRQGEIFGFLGANGAGKTTTIKILCGLSSPTSGEIRVIDFDVYSQREQIKKNIGYMSQKFSMYGDLNVLENFRFYGGIYGLSNEQIRQKLNFFLQRMHMETAKDKLLKNLPPGWKQKLAFAVAIMHEPKIVFLDEPTAGVDPLARQQFWQMIYETAQSGITVFVTTHYMDEAEYCDRVSIMTEGEIAVLDSPKMLKKIFKAASMEEVFLTVARN